MQQKPFARNTVRLARTPCKIITSHAACASLLQAHGGASEVVTGKVSTVHKRVATKATTALPFAATSSNAVAKL